MGEDSVRQWLGVWQGTGELCVDRWDGVPPAPVQVALDGRTLDITVKLSKKHPLYRRWLNASPESYSLRSCKLRRRGLGQTDSVDFRMDEVVGWDSTSERMKVEDLLRKGRLARIVVRLSQRRVVLNNSSVLDSDRPYQVAYQRSGAFHVVMPPLSSGGAAHSIHAEQPAHEKMVLFHSRGNFLPQERHMHAAWSLLQGGVMERVLEVEGSVLRLYGGSAVPCKAHFPMVRRTDGGLASSVLNGFLSVDAQRFAAWYEPLKMYLAGKALPTYVEVSFLMAMSCVEALDDVHGLHENTTAAMLGVDRDFAKLCNCLRNKLFHGEGGFQSAYASITKREFPNKATVAAAFVNAAGEFDGLGLMFRLWERMDALWGACVGVPPELINQDRVTARRDLVPPGPPVDLELFRDQAAKVRRFRELGKQAKKPMGKQSAAQRQQIPGELTALKEELAQFQAASNAAAPP